MRDIIKQLAFLVLFSISALLVYRVVKPIPFLFISGLSLSIIYFFLLTSYRKKPATNEYNITRQSSFYSAIIFIVLFFISLKTMKDYQLPAGNSPYFNNADHYVIQNYGIAFQQSLDLYYNESDENKGLISCETGYFRIETAPNTNPVFHLNNFYLPLFSKSKSRLLNPLFKENITTGTSIGDSSNKLMWEHCSSKTNDGIPVFDMTLIFNSSDPDLLGSLYNPDQSFYDTLIINKLELKTGLDLKTILLKSKKANLPGKREIVFRWLDHFSKIYLLTKKDELSGSCQLSLFPGYDFFKTGNVFGNAVPLKPDLVQTIPFDTVSQFYAGLENTQESFKIRKQNSSEKYLSDQDYFVLEFKGMGYLPLTAGPDGSSKTGTSEVRFMKNTYAQLGVDEIRQGFLFHDNMKNNGLTKMNALLEYRIEQTGKPLNWKIHSLGAAHQISQSNQLFSLKSDNKQLVWLFKFEDLSLNRFNFKHTIWYLLILILIIISLTTFTPGTKVIFIETPVLIIVYLFFVFRLLLLWRVATFPPLENISPGDFDKLRNFDIIKGFPFSMSIICLLLISIVFIRYYYNNLTALINRIRINKESWWARNFWIKHIVLLIICSLLLKVLKAEYLSRILAIIIPLLSYIYFSRQIILRQAVIHYKPPTSKSGLIQYMFRFLSTWINSPLFFLSLFTLVFLGYWDTGFAVLFLFFLVIKSILFNFSYQAKNASAKFIHKLTEPSAYWIFGLLAFAGLFYMLADKTAVAFILSGKNLLITSGLVLFVIASLVLIRPAKYRSVIRLFPLLLLVAFCIPSIKNYIEKSIDDKIRHVVYRTSILFQPLEKMLFNFEYNSGKEQKIIETAQNQWFINSYLDKEKTNFIESKKINFRPHFKKGVDYITQTRDVVLPRYVIAEFGGFTMFLLLLSFAIPLILYFLAYRLRENNSYNASSYTGAITLTLLFVMTLFVWLSSTNRFVFFGQDFPFLSLTSRISTLFPMLLVVTLLLQSPLQRFKFGSPGNPRWLGLLLLFLIPGSVILISGKSKLIPPGRFNVDFTKVENRIDDINVIFKELQQTQDDPAKALTIDQLKKNSDRFISNITHLFDLLYADKRFQKVYDSCTTYEKSILDKLHSNPRTGFDISSPVHLKYDDEQLYMVFNRYFRLELPAYEIKSVWKGDIAQESFRDETIGQHIRYINSGSAGNSEMIIVPSAYLQAGEGKKGILNHFANKPNSYLQSFIYSGKSKLLREAKPISFAEIIDSSDIVFLTDPTGNYKGSWTINTYERPYFSYSFQINGRERQIYPMGKSFFWIRHYSLTNKLHYEDLKQYETSATLSLDYKLTDSVNRFLQSELRKHDGALPELNFSVIAADGNGKLRLMADFDMKRELLDPNDNRSIALKEKEQYFIVSNEAERKQWGNINLLRMKQGPGSSIKPIIATAASSQLKLEWENMFYQNYQGFSFDNKGMILINKYAGLDLGKQVWKTEPRNNKSISLPGYIQESHNLYHSLLMFIGSYQKDRFLKNGNYSLKNLLSTTPGDSLCVFPIIRFAGDNKNYFLPGKNEWPGTSATTPENIRLTYFGNTQSLIARGLSSNFELLIEPTNKSGYTNQKNNFTNSLPDTIMKNGIWSFPEESYFLQSDRISNNLRTNFTIGLRNPTLGGSPYQISPIKMLEMYGKLASLNSRYKVRIDQANADSIPTWNYDPQTWGTLNPYLVFLNNNIFKGMGDVLIPGGTARQLNNGSNNYRDYHLYAKTGTIDGSSNEDNSKRLALIISKEPLNPISGIAARFYVVFFTIGNAYKDLGQDKSWFWIYYRRILDMITESESFKLYMK